MFRDNKYRTCIHIFSFTRVPSFINSSKCFSLCLCKSHSSIALLKASFRNSAMAVMLCCSHVSIIRSPRECEMSWGKADPERSALKCIPPKTHGTGRTPVIREHPVKLLPLSTNIPVHPLEAMLPLLSSLTMSSSSLVILFRLLCRVVVQDLLWVIWFSSLS